jgi:hypothetical protein
MLSSTEDWVTTHQTGGNSGQRLTPTDHGAYGPAGYVCLAIVGAAWLPIRVLVGGSFWQLRTLKHSSLAMCG